MEHIVILGNGISGITAARHIRKYSDKRITIVSGESEHFFSRTALMYVYMGHMRWRDIKPYEDWFWEKNRLELKHGWVTRIDFSNKTLHFAEGGTMTYDRLILATGSVYNTFGWEGQQAKGVVGMVSKQDLEAIEAYAPNNKICPHAVIVGGGLIGVELAEMLRTRDIRVTFLVRENGFWSNKLPLPDAKLLSRHIASHHVDLKHDTELDRILTTSDGNVSGVLTSTGEKISCQMVGLTTGVRPNIDFLKPSEIETDRGILVNRRLETSVEDVYAIGDCVQQREPIEKRPAIEAVWYTGRMMGETVAQTICGHTVEYRPGHWFNSAKFFDIEYQTYGWVNPQKRKSATESHFHWQHPDGTKAITVAYDLSSGTFLGINTYGIRMKHEVFDRWLTKKQHVDYVMDHLHEANFDPEFCTRYEEEIRFAYHSMHQKTSV